MVNNLNVRLVQITEVILKTSGQRTKISNGPIYSLPIAKSLLQANGLRVINDAAEADQASFDPILTDAELAKLILALEETHYIESERCRASVGMTIDCDAYAIRWNRIREQEWEHSRKIFVKFGFRPANPRCLVVSIHPARW